MNERWRKPVGLLLLAVLSLGVAACGDDDDDDVAASGDTSEEETDTTAAEDEEGEGEGNPCAPDAPDDAVPPADEPAEDATEITVIAKEYEFVGADALDPGGSFAITLENEGAELHEMAIVRLAEGEDRPLEEMIASEEEPDLTEIGFGLVCPGESTVINADVSEPGRYVAVCFITVGSTPDVTEEPEGPPHAARGMVHEFNVG